MKARTNNGLSTRTPLNCFVATFGCVIVLVCSLLFATIQSASAAVFTTYEIGQSISNAKAYLKLGKVKEAMADFSEIIKRNPNDPGAYLIRALARDKYERQTPGVSI